MIGVVERGRGLVLIGIAIVALGATPAGADEGHGPESRRAPGEKHAHESPHGGIVVTVGDVHAELAATAVDSGVRFDLYILGSTEGVTRPIAAPSLKAVLRLDGVEGYPSVVLTAAPLAGERAGMASRFTGTTQAIAGHASGQATVRIPIGGKTYRAVFSGTFGAESEHGDDDHHDEAPHGGDDHDEDGGTHHESDRGH